MPGEMTIPCKVGQLELREGAGRCIVENCGVRGGGLIQMQHTTNREEELRDLAWEGRRVTICGSHLVEVLTTVLKLA